LFFVLSGFLITGILLDTRHRQGALPVFFARRSLRIFPLYYCVLIVIFFIAPIVEQLLGKQAPTLQHSTAWMWLYGFNFLIAKFNTFDLGPVLSLLGPFWSLSVEEQFYLVLPLLIIRMPFRRIPWLLLSVVVIAVGLRWYWIAHFPPPQIATYVLLPFRMDSLAIGGLVAWIWRRFPGVLAVRQMARYSSAGVGVLALYGVASGWPSYSFLDFGIWRLSILVFLWGALILRVVSSLDTSRANRLLCVAWLKMFGRYSYGIYVYHFVVIALLVPPLEKIVSNRVHSQLISLLLAKGLALGVALTVAFMSWHIIEQPFLSLKRNFKFPEDAGVQTSSAYPAARATRTPDGAEPTN
jgi:peptidoglycan/LPS O-acetylase OafA/YrhL